MSGTASGGFDIVLYEPEIPPNTGNIIRLCANTGCRLHLVKPLGFRLNERAARRAGLDYGDADSVTLHEDWQACAGHFTGRRMFAVSTRASQSHVSPAYLADDVFVFGPETRGLPQALLERFPDAQRVRLPMREGSRSLNLANAVAVMVYEAWRQSGFEGGR